jgi:uncharacterized membrane protein YfcA
MPPASGRRIEVAVRPRDYLFLLGAVVAAVASAEVLHQAPNIVRMASPEHGFVALSGFLAQLVDGALGMGYGVTSSTVLVASGIQPSMASGIVHLAQLGTTLASGVAHHLHRTVDWPTVQHLAPSGAFSAFGGALLLSSFTPKAAKTVASSLLFSLGAYVCVRFFFGIKAAQRSGSPSSGLLIPLGLVGGFVDATGGGGWGPVVTSGLLADARLSPSKAIGTVSASEFVVTVSAVLGFLLSFSSHGSSENLRLDLAAMLLAGGLFAAPVAPLFVTTLAPELLGVVVGGFICLTNTRGVLTALSVSPAYAVFSHLAVALVWVTAIVLVVSRQSKGRAQVEASSS